MRHACLAVLVFLAIAHSFGSEPAQRTLSFEDRVAAQKAIEQVYWNHRIWPKENPGPKPPLSAVLPDAAIRTKVEDSLRQSEALAALWKRPITADQLQTELDRMVTQTRDGATLGELFSALEHDPARIAESVARPVLVRRLIHDWYAFDPRFHGDLRTRAETAVAACHTISCMKTLGGDYNEAVWRRQDAATSTPAGSAIDIAADDWTARLVRLARAVGGEPDHLSVLRPGRLDESSEAFTITAVLSQSDSEVRVATTTWTKRSFDNWWAEASQAFAPIVPPTSGKFTIATPQSTTCTDDTWTAIPNEIPEPRSRHTVVWTGSEMIVWGGGTSNFEATGGRYVPATDTWTFTSTVGTPSARYLHTAVWTGTKMIVWGGYGAIGVLGTGGQYDPSTDSWTLTSTGANAPAAREGHTAVWTGTEMIVWGGDDGVGVGHPFNSGGRYNVSTDTWLATSSGTNLPAARTGATAVWTGSQMIVWGGRTAGYTNTGGSYTPATDTWVTTSTGTNVPTGRIQHTAVWTGSVMIVWGGLPCSGCSPVNTGGEYYPSSDRWTATSTDSNVPRARQQHAAVWTGTEMIVWGGSTASPTYLNLNTGGRFNPSTNTWYATSTGPNVPVGRYAHTAVWTDSEMIVWGGDTDVHSYTGGRYNPTSDSWVPTSTGSIVPTARFEHTGIWTGAELMIWGGRGDGPCLDTGGSYDPATASWISIAQTGAPTGRHSHTAVWTGTKMLVWGGANSDYSVVYNTGGAYDPAGNSWMPTSIGINDPAARDGHSAVWTGTEMIVWGGQTTSTPLNTGGRYAPAIDSWTPTSTGTNVPTARAWHTATWTGSAMVIWGDIDNANTGGRYFPATDSWLPTSTGANVPAIGNGYSSAVWTGSRVIIWGGYHTFIPSSVNTGAIYDPVGDTWAPTSVGVNCPSARYGHKAVWTGRQMIVWGGLVGPNSTNTGARYDPSTDTWTPTLVGTNVPSARSWHSAIWTGTEMISWGGNQTTATGGCYCDCPYSHAVYRDTDGDGFGDPSATTMSSCDGAVPTGYVANSLDCDDTNPLIYPNAPEINDGIDNQCPGDPGYGMIDELGNSGSVAADKVTFSWAAQQNATSYELARSTTPDFSVSCASFAASSPTFQDLLIPKMHVILYYIVRAMAPHVGSWGKTSAGTERTTSCP